MLSKRPCYAMEEKLLLTLAKYIKMPRVLALLEIVIIMKKLLLLIDLRVEDYALIPFQNTYTGTANIVTGGVQYNF